MVVSLQDRHEFLPMGRSYSVIVLPLRTDPGRMTLPKVRVDEVAVNPQ